MQIDRPIAIAVTLLIIFLLMFFLVVPEYNTFMQLRTELAKKTAEFNAQHDYYAAIDKADLDLQSHQSDIEKINDALPKNPAVGELIYFLQNSAKQSGLIVKDLFLSKLSSNSNQSGASGGVRDMVFSADLIGDYPVLESFVASLEKSSRIFEVTNISFDSNTGPPYDFSLQIETHSY